MKKPVGSNGRVFFDLSTRVKLRISGADRLRFLNGQLTNDVRKATAAKAIEACVLNAKGKMDAHLFLHVEGDSYVSDADPAVASILQARLERYIIADDVLVEDVTKQLSLFHAIGETVSQMSTGPRVVFANRFGVEGQDLWIDTAKHDELRAELSKTLTFCDENCAENYRIEQGIPRWGRELTNEIIPVEANLEARCIDYEKGCYIGQETISRMKMSGQRNKQLCGLLSVENLPLAAGARLATGGKDVGWITSATRSGDRQIALGYVKRGSNSPGSQLEAARPGIVGTIVEIVDVPFLR